MAGFLPSNFKEVKQRELDPVQRAILAELKRRDKKPKAKVFRDPQDKDSFFIPELGTLIRPKKGR